jgi:hypothetical protein
MQADRFQQFLQRLTHICVVIDDEYGWHILRAHNGAPQSEGKANQNVASYSIVANQAPVDDAG